MADNTDRQRTKVEAITADLVEEQRALDLVVSEMHDTQWSLPTPSPGWTVADQIGHLGYFDRTAALAIAEPSQFESARTELVASLADNDAMTRVTLDEPRNLDPAELLEWWRTSRRRLIDASSTLADGDRVEWYGPSMGARSFLTARLMEVWAHGQDIVDTVGATRAPTDRLQHIAQLGVITRSWSYLVRGLEPPTGEVFVELAAPSGTTWAWGEPNATQRVTGPAEDFCLVVTQRRNIADTAIEATHGAAADWMSKAQAFAGDATEGPSPAAG